jgi:hypothetical protein
MYRQISFYARVTFLKNTAQIEITQTKHKTLIKNGVFPGLGDWQPHAIKCVSADSESAVSVIRRLPRPEKKNLEK